VIYREVGCTFLARKEPRLLHGNISSLLVFLILLALPVEVLGDPPVIDLPLDSDVDVSLSAGFGDSDHHDKGTKGEFAVDVRVPQGTRIIAPFDGIVRYQRYPNGGFLTDVVIGGRIPQCKAAPLIRDDKLDSTNALWILSIKNPANNVVITMLHLSEQTLFPPSTSDSAEVKVTQGQVIAKTGGALNSPGSGCSSGSHIHMEVTDSGKLEAFQQSVPFEINVRVNCPGDCKPRRLSIRNLTQTTLFQDLFRAPIPPPDHMTAHSIGGGKVGSGYSVFLDWWYSAGDPADLNNGGEYEVYRATSFSGDLCSNPNLLRSLPIEGRSESTLDQFSEFEDTFENTNVKQDDLYFYGVVAVNKNGNRSTCKVLTDNVTQKPRAVKVGSFAWGVVSQKDVEEKDDGSLLVPRTPGWLLGDVRLAQSEGVKIEYAKFWIKWRCVERDFPSSDLRADLKPIEDYIQSPSQSVPEKVADLIEWYAFPETSFGGKNPFYTPLTAAKKRIDWSAYDTIIEELNKLGISPVPLIADGGDTSCTKEKEEDIPKGISPSDPPELGSPVVWGNSVQSPSKEFIPIGEDAYLARAYLHTAAAALRYSHGWRRVILWNTENELNWVWTHAIPGWREVPCIETKAGPKRSKWLEYEFIKNLLRTLYQGVKDGSALANEGSPQARSTMNINIHSSQSAVISEWIQQWLQRQWKCSTLTIDYLNLTLEEFVTDLRDYMDVIGLGAYPNLLFDRPVLGMLLYPAVQDAVRRGDSKPVIVMETGYGTAPAFLKFLGKQYSRDDQLKLQNDYLLQAACGTYSNKVAGLFWFTLEDSVDLEDNIPDNPFDAPSGLMGPQGETGGPYELPYTTFKRLTTAIPLKEAAQQGYVDLESKGRYSGDAITIKATGKNTEDVSVLVCPGDVLLNRDPRKQNLVVSLPDIIPIPANAPPAVLKEGIFTFCIDGRRSGPAKGDKYDVTLPLTEWSESAAQLLIRLLDVINQQGLHRTSEAQQAVWKITNNINALDRAAELLVEAGINPNEVIKDFPRLSNPRDRLLPTSFVTPQTIATTPWRMFRHDAQRIGRSLEAGPQQEPKQTWVFQGANGLGIYSSPAVGLDGTIYVASLEYLFALMPDGKEKWKQKIGFWVRSSPAVGPDGTVYVASGDGKLYAINPDGTEKWKFETPSLSPIYSSPAVGSDGTIYISALDSVTCSPEVGPEETLV
jgi:hypothetical protein